MPLNKKNQAKLIEQKGYFENQIDIFRLAPVVSLPTLY